MTKFQELLFFVQQRKLVTREEIKKRGFSDTYLQRLLESGEVFRVSHGLYSATESIPSEYQSLIEVSLRYPSGVICLLSALSFHNLTTQLPFEVWCAFEPSKAPRKSDLSLRIVRMPKVSLAFGVEFVRLQGRRLKITSPAKTVADCLKYRGLVGGDVAVEALKNYLRQHKKLDDLSAAAKVCGVDAVLRTYLEVLL